MRMIQNVRGGRVVRLFVMLAIAIGVAGTAEAAPKHLELAVPGRVSNDGTVYRGNAARTGVEPGPAPVGEPLELWQQTFERPTTGTPAVANGSIYVNSWDGFLHAFDAETGSEIWTFETGGIDGTPAIADGVIFTGATLLDGKAGELYALDAKSGEQIWGYQTTFPIDVSSPVVVDGVVYVGSETYEDEDGGGLHAVKADSGEEIWSIETVAAIESSPAVVDGVVYVGSGSILSTETGFFAYDAATGEQIWSFKTDEDAFMYPASVVDGMVYAASMFQVYAFDAETGDVVWTFGEDKGFFDGAPSVVGGVVYVGGGDLFALDARTGEAIWQFVNAEYVSSPVVVDGVVFAGTFGNEILAVNAETGREVWRYTSETESDIADRIIAGSMAIVDGVIYFTSYNWEADLNPGSLHAIGIAD